MEHPVPRGHTGRITTGTKMRIQVVNRYLELVDQGNAPAPVCKNDEDHGRVFAKLDDDDNIILWCLACEYNAQLGISMYDKMYDIVWMYDEIGNISE